MANAPFFPLQSLADELLPCLPGACTDGSHDLAHVQRVWSNVRRIQAKEGGDLEVLLAATVLHDCVAVEKNSPLRSQASTLSAKRAAAILTDKGWPSARVEQAAHAVQAHSYSAGIAPLSLEARILQDSDRLDALGAVGVARCFYVAGRMGSSLYDFENPTAEGRDHQDNRYAIEHFHTKLLKLASGFQTTEGARLATLRHERLASFLDDFMDEIGVA
ncbi:HD domain-containing protein [Pseudomonas hunanensis]|uniref:HD domain-containing protein n=1 Tax=Pseudomonas hunanensis TaxID=1247546 RepID=UPI002406235A|nr:HD domain-containing protein [Pseudomonas hunanensis]MDF9756153.1 uncharacterized protein [Pseudomonas hunanensis]